MTSKMKALILAILVAATLLLPQVAAFADDPKPPVPCTSSPC